MSVLAIHDLMPLSLLTSLTHQSSTSTCLPANAKWNPLPVVNLAKKEGCIALKESQEESGYAPPSALLTHSWAGNIALRPQSSNN